MHLALALTSVLLVMLSGYLALGILRHLDDWSHRRDVQFFVMAAPLASLGLGIAGLYHFIGRNCFHSAPPWDSTLAVALPVSMGLVALGGLGLGLVRLMLMGRVVACGVPANPELQTLATRLAQQLGMSGPRLRLCTYDRPLALTYGLLRPTVLISSWMVEHLDRHELESVLAHELGHVARRDYLLVWLATVLRDAFFYLPTNCAAYRHLQHEKELACDDLAIRATNRPLALASALAKVWQQASSQPRFGPAQLLVGTDALIEGRIERLLTAPDRASTAIRARTLVLSTRLAALAGIVLLEAMTVVTVLALMGCGPALLLERLI